MRQVTVALVILQQGDSYLLQHRIGDARIGAANLFGLFGGKLELGESPLEAAVRELSEETSLRVPTSDLRLLGTVRVQSDHLNEPVAVISHTYYYAVPRTESVTTDEGVLVSIPIHEAQNQSSAMTPATRAAFEQYMWRSV